MDRDTLWLIPLIIDGRGKTGLPPISDLVAMVSLDEQEISKVEASNQQVKISTEHLKSVLYFPRAALFPVEDGWCKSII